MSDDLIRTFVTLKQQAIVKLICFLVLTVYKLSLMNQAIFYNKSHFYFKCFSSFRLPLAPTNSCIAKIIIVVQTPIIASISSSSCSELS